MNITGAKWAGGELILTTSSPDAVRFAMAFEPGDYTLAKERKKRSLDANGYAWVLIDKIAAVMRLSKEEVYRNTIRDIGGNSEIVCIPDKGVETLRRCWESNGLGWQMDTMPSKLPGCVNAVLYYGSSAYSSSQMSIMIDRLKQDAEALGIETIPPEKLRALLEAWDG